ncbi:MAG TPA: hypothetical protein VGJ29_09635, partial [Vicinamibacterales bacterium]
MNNSGAALDTIRAAAAYGGVGMVAGRRETNAGLPESSSSRTRRSFLLTWLPETYDYRVIFMRRDLGEVV